jgi:guanylate kinase
MDAVGKQVVVIAGPTGSGETTITNEIVKRFPSRAERLVTATTRPPRTGEQHGVDYYFLSPEEFAKCDAEGGILEKTYIANRNTYYGTYAADLHEKIASGKIVIVNPDLVGARYYKDHFNAATIFIVPQSIDALERRIRQRNPELSDAEIGKRRANAQAEIENEESFYDYKVTNVDGKLSDAVDEVLAILKKEGYNLD